LSVGALAALAGCTESGDGDGTQKTSETESPHRDSSETDATAESPATSDSNGEDLDLREANVVGVSFEERNGTYTFDVTLHHDDDGEEGYANWWQVERLDGTRLGRRDLLHAHSQQPFTRSETIDFPDDVTCVVVRGHDQTYEYGGLAMVVDLDSGKTQTFEQGPAKQSFDASDCPGQN